MAEIAEVFDDSERSLRERWRITGREPLGSLIAFGCSLRAAWLVHTEREKTSNAAREAGHARAWSLNQQLRPRLGVTLRDCRDRLPDNFDWNRLFAAQVDLKARTSHQVELSA